MTDARQGSCTASVHKNPVLLMPGLQEARSSSGSGNLARQRRTPALLRIGRHAQPI